MNINLVRTICDSLEGKNSHTYERYFTTGNIWRHVELVEALNDIVNGYEVRIRPEFTTREITYASAETVAPEYGKKYYIAGTNTYRYWANHEIDLEYLANGRVYLFESKRDKVNEAIWGPTHE